MTSTQVTEDSYVSTTSPAVRPSKHFSIVIVGGGAAGLATAASILQRKPDIDIAIVEPRQTHNYQPGWTMVGGGVFHRAQTHRPMAKLIPKGAQWLCASVSQFKPDANIVELNDGTFLSYWVLIVAPGISLKWDLIDGLQETLGKNGVTSNYLSETAPYTWELTRTLREGTALFTQPPLPIKCAGAPQKAMYLSCDHWRRTGALPNIDVSFHNAGDVLFGVKDYVPALMGYVERYGIDLAFNSNLIAVDGPGRRATFKTPQGEVTRSFDMLHVCPPQKAPAFIIDSPLSGDSGFIDVDRTTLRHVRYENIFGLGDACATPNAKTAAAARKQAPIVAVNALSFLNGGDAKAAYDGYGSCPLTVERGKIVLAEFGYGGTLLPSFPRWFIDGKRPSRLSWLLKEKLLPWVYWNAMLKGREWLAAPSSFGESQADGH
jgi:sulfide:quinone oxidoreductase